MGPLFKALLGAAVGVVAAKGSELVGDYLASKFSTANSLAMTFGKNPEPVMRLAPPALLAAVAAWTLKGELRTGVLAGVLTHAILCQRPQTAKPIQTSIMDRITAFRTGNRSVDGWGVPSIRRGSFA